MKKLLITTIFIVFGNLSFTNVYNDFSNHRDAQYFKYIQSNNQELSNLEIYNIMKLVYKNSEKYNVNRQLIFAVMKVESNFNFNISSPKGAFGYMQIMKPLADYKKLNRLTKEGNIEIGVSFLKDTTNTFGYTNSAVAAYNKGIAGVKRNGYRNTETYNYVMKVRKELEILNSMMNYNINGIKAIKQ